MVVVGTLNDIAQSLDVSVSVAGQLIAVAAAVMCFGAPLLAGWVGGLDRRKLLAASLALVRDRPRALRADAELRGAAAGARPHRPRRRRVHAAGGRGDRRDDAAGRARRRDHLHLHRLVARLGRSACRSSAWLGDTFGWRSAFFAIAALGAVGAVWVLAAMPAGVRPATLTLARLARAFANPVLMAIVAGHRARRRRPVHAVLVLRAVLQERRSARARARSTLLFVWFGVFGVIGNTLASRYVDRFGADARGRLSRWSLMAVSLLAWPLAANGVGRRRRPRALGARRASRSQLGAAGAPRRRGAGARARR